MITQQIVFVIKRNNFYLMTSQAMRASPQLCKVKIVDKIINIYCKTINIYYNKIVNFIITGAIIMHKIKTTSHILSLFFRTLCWFMPIIIGSLILFDLEDLRRFGMWSEIVMFQYTHNISNFSWTHKFIILAIEALPLSITIMICHKLAQLFRLFEKNYLFENENIKLIKHISIYMLLGEAVKLIHQFLMSAALTFNNPIGERFAALHLSISNASTLITACIIFIASWIMQEAQQLKYDAQLTV